MGALPQLGLRISESPDSACQRDFGYLPVTPPNAYSSPMRKVFLEIVCCLTLAVTAVAQHPASTQRKIDEEFVHQQFGDQFTYMSNVGAVFGDLDGDGVEDIVIAARCKNPMLDQSEHNYTVIDPYDAFFGYGNPAVTTTFSEGDPALRGLVMLIIEGSGDATWRSNTPKGKYVIVNLPYRAIYVRKFRLKKKTIDALYVEEAGSFGTSGAVFFDGKKFQYVPMGGDME